MTNYPTGYDTSATGYTGPPVPTCSLPPVIPQTILGPTGPTGPAGPAGPIGTIGTSNNWQTALDIDLTAQPSQILGSDGPVTIAGLIWTKINSVNEQFPTQLINGTGLVFYPASTGDIYGGTLTLPAFTLPLNIILPNISFDTPIRVTLYNSQDNASQDFDSCVFAIANLNNYTNIVCKRTYQYGLAIDATANYNAGNLGQSVTSGVYNNNVMTMSIISGIGSFKAQYYAGMYNSAIFPQVSPQVSVGVLNGVYFNVFDGSYMQQISNWQLLMGAHRAGSSNNSYTTTIARINVQYLNR